MKAEAEILDFPQPHDDEVEQVLLGSLWRDNRYYHRISEFLGCEHFHASLHARLYEKSAELISEGKRADALTIRRYFDGDGVDDDGDATYHELGGKGYLAHIAAGGWMLDGDGVAAYARNIVELAEQRRVLDAMDKGRELALSPSTNAQEIAASTIDLIIKGSGLSRDRSRQHNFSLHEASQIVLTRVNDHILHGKVIDDSAYPGSDILREAIGGWHRKRLYVLGGRPAIGKSSLALAWLIRTAMKGHGVLFISLEMEATELLERAQSDISWRASSPIPYENITNGKIDDDQYNRLTDADEQFKKLPFQIDDLPNMSLAQIRAIAQTTQNRFASRGCRLDVVAIDHMALVRCSDRYAGNRTQEIEELSYGLKSMAKDLDIAVLALSQLNRALESREEKRPTLADLRQSGSIEQDADVVLFCHRDHYYLSRRNDLSADEKVAMDDREHVIEVDIAKNRGGACRRLKFYCDIGCNVVRDSAPAWQGGL